MSHRDYSRDWPISQPLNQDRLSLRSRRRAISLGQVRDTSDDYDFKPGELVTGICRIYTQLECDQFCAAVAADERSYSPQLFTDAIQVLGESPAPAGPGEDA